MLGLSADQVQAQLQDLSGWKFAQNALTKQFALAHFRAAQPQAGWRWGCEREGPRSSGQSPPGPTRGTVCTLHSGLPAGAPGGCHVVARAGGLRPGGGGEGGRP